MNTLEALDARKSVRGYQDKPVEDEKLETLLKYANKAPIAGVFHMTVVTDAAVLEEINETGKQAALDSGDEFMISRVTLPGYKLTYGAPVLVVFSAPEGGFSAMNVSLAAENMCIAACELGLGTCFLAGFLMAFQAKPELAAKLGIPEGFVPQCGLIVGYEGESAIPTVARAEADNVNYLR